MRRSAFFAFAFLIAGVVPVRAAKQLNKAVHVSVAAPWSSTPLALEASEFFASDTNAASSHGDQFWKYVEALPAGVISQHDKAQYDAAIAAATPLLSTSQLDLLEYALAIRQFSPTLQAHRELWQTAESLGCSIKDGAAVAILNDRDCITDPAALKEAIKAARQGGPGGTVLDMDHEYTGSNATSGVVVHLFATVGSETFRAFHKKLSKSATKGKIRYVLRHAWPEKEDASAHPMMVQGYGVEMAIKNMEYKAVDDQKKEGGASAEDGGEEEDEVAGFDFKVLLQRKPEREVELLSLRDALLSEARQAESTDIKVWALKDLGVQASQRILQADDPLRLIRDLSHNLPALVGSLSRMRVNATIRAELESNRNYMHPGTNMLFVNGRTLHLDALTPYKLFEFVRHEVRMMESMQDLGLDVRSGRKVLNAPSAGGGMGGMMGGGESGFKLDVLSDDNVHWVNDIEKDDMYSSWPRSLDALLQRGWPGQMRHVRRNLFTLIYMIDPDSMEDLAHVSDAWAMVQHQMPVRFGFIFKSAAAALNPASVAPADAGAGAAAEGAKEEEEGSGRASPAAAAAVSDGVGLYRLFRSLYERHGKQAAFAFVDSYYHRAAVAVGGADGRRDIRKQVFKETVKKFRAPSKKARAKYDRDLKSAAADEVLHGCGCRDREEGGGRAGASVCVCVLARADVSGRWYTTAACVATCAGSAQELRLCTEHGRRASRGNVCGQRGGAGGAESGSE
jgi:UDP-glucose:glycoprotein glucosyltransferase